LEGNVCKIKVVQYGYDMKIQWVTYKLASGYSKIGTATPPAYQAKKNLHLIRLSRISDSFRGWTGPCPVIGLLSGKA